MDVKNQELIFFPFPIFDFFVFSHYFHSCVLGCVFSVESYFFISSFLFFQLSFHYDLTSLANSLSSVGSRSEGPDPPPSPARAEKGWGCWACWG